MTSLDYVHGYRYAWTRMADQAGTLADLLHHDTQYPAGSRVLEAGCGVGAQTRILARRSPDARFTSVDVSASSLALARETIAREGLHNVEFRQADLFALPIGSDPKDSPGCCDVLRAWWPCSR